MAWLLLSFYSMVLLISDRPDGSGVETYLREKGVGVRVVSLKDFSQDSLKGKALVIYDTDDLTERDVVNIMMVKKEDIPLVLIIPYLDEKGLKEVSRLWKGGYLKDCLIKPINVEDLLKYIPQGH